VDLKELFPILGLSPANQVLVVLVAALVGSFWWIYTKGLADLRVYEKQLQIAVDELYSPAVGLLLGRKSGLISQEEFDRQFLDLALKHRSKGNPRIQRAFRRWLEGEKIEKGLEDRLIKVLDKTLMILQRHPFSIWLRIMKWVALTGWNLIIFIFCIQLIELNYTRIWGWIQKTNVFGIRGAVVVGVVSLLITLITSREWAYDIWSKWQEKKRLNIDQNDNARKGNKKPKSQVKNRH
jgi:hypothetical protein